MNPRIKLLFVVGTALTIGRALDLGLWTDLESGLCAVGPVWLRYAALAVGVLAAICIGRKLAHGPQELRNHCKPSGIVTAMAGAFFTAAGFLRFAVGMTGAGSFVRAILEILCGQWLAQLAKSWLRKDWQPPTKSMASGIWGTLVFYWCVLSRFMENSSSWHRFTHGAGLGAAGDARLSVQSGAGALAARNVGWKSPVRLRSGSLCPRLLLGAAPDPDAGDALTVRPHGAALHLFWSGHGLPWDTGRVLHRAHRRACGQKEVKASTLLAELLKTGPDKGQKSYKSQKVNKRVVNFLADT